MNCIPQVPLSMGFPRKEYWNGLPFPSPRDLPDSGVKSVSLVSPALAGRLSTTVPPGKDITEVNTGYCLILLQLLV